jgi:hypothetical protein
VCSGRLSWSIWPIFDSLTPFESAYPLNLQGF